MRKYEGQNPCVEAFSLPLFPPLQLDCNVIRRFLSQDRRSSTRRYEEVADSNVHEAEWGRLAVEGGATHALAFQTTLTSVSKAEFLSQTPARLPG